MVLSALKRLVDSEFTFAKAGTLNSALTPTAPAIMISLVNKFLLLVDMLISLEIHEKSVSEL